MKQIFPAVCRGLRDKDEKAVANAIRSISHTAYFVYFPGCISDEGTDTTPTEIELYRSLLSALSEKINFAIDDAAGEGPKELTWKQRNSAKKHAWGACTTLGMLLNFTDTLAKIEDSSVESSLASLFLCIQLSTSINEKILASAVKGLESIPPTVWRHMSNHECDAIGRGLATCLGFLQTSPMSKSSYYESVENLVTLLLASAKRADFCRLFLIQESVPFSVEYFYQWLVNRDIEAAILDEVAEAVSSQEVETILDVSVAQMFLSRTVQQNQRRGSPRKDSVSLLRLDDDHDDEDDEL